jgi:SecD/SecF fusion protein
MKDLVAILVALFVLLGGAFAAAVAVVMLSSGSCSASDRRVGVVLIYEVAADSASDSEPVDMQAVVDAVDRRVNPPKYNNARVRQLDDRRIEIGVFGSDSAKLRRIERLLKRPGTLQFRILANRHDHESLIERARSENADVLNDAKGNAEAWWVPVRDGAALEDPGYPGFVPDYWDIEKRTRKQGPHEILEVLAIKDLFDVTDAYLEEAEPDKDAFGRPCVSFKLNAAGASRLGAITGDNLPDPLQDFTRRLGIIVDGQLYSAPVIESPIFERGQITGMFTREEIAELVGVLNAGALPAAIRQVGKRKVSADQ